MSIRQPLLCLSLPLWVCSLQTLHANRTKQCMDLSPFPRWWQLSCCHFDLWWMGLLRSFTHKALGSHTSHFSSMRKPSSRMSGLYANLLEKRQFSQTVIPFYFPVSTLDEADCDFSTPRQHWRLSVFLFSGYKVAFLSEFVLFFNSLTLSSLFLSQRWGKSQCSFFTSHLWTGEVTDSGTEPSADSVPSGKHPPRQRDYRACLHPRTPRRPVGFRSFQLWLSQTINLYCLKLSSLSQFSLWLHR